MTVFLIILIASIILYLVFSAIVAEGLVKSFMLTPGHTEEETRKTEAENGFGEALRLYDNVWHRERFSIESNGETLIGDIIENTAPSGNEKVAIVCHGMMANRICSLKYARMLYDLGYSLVVYDHRFYGESTGNNTTLGYMETKDLLNVISFVKEKFGENVRIALQGESMGAATVLNSLKSFKPYFAAVDCPFSDTIMLMKQVVKVRFHLPAWPVINILRSQAHSRFNYFPDEVVPIDGVKNTSCPILFTHGENDTLIPCVHSERMFKVSSNPLSEIHLFDGADHAESIIKHPVEYEKIFKEFIHKVENASV